jgi:hypothetical protein
MTLQFGYNVAVEYARFYIPIIYIDYTYRCKNMLLRFYVQEMALVFKEKQVVPLRPIDGAVLQQKACRAFTSNRWRCCSKKAWFYLYLPQV